MKRPAFQFYPADWQRDANLRRCSHAARGAWMDVLCLLHDADDYGILRWPLAEIAQAAGAPLKLLRELADKGVIRGGDKGEQRYVYTPRHAGKDGDPVTLIDSGEGPLWYCARFVRDEYVRSRRGESSRFGADNSAGEGVPKAKPKTPPKGGFGDPEGYGASSSSSSSSRNEASTSPPASPAPDERIGQFEGHDAPAEPPNPHAPFAIALNRAGFRCTSLNPDLIAYAAAGGTVEHLGEWIANPEVAGKPATYVLRAARRELADRAAPIAGTPRRTAAPSKQLAGVASILGVNAHDLAASFAADACGSVVRDADRAVPGGALPAEPRRLSGG